MLISCVILFKVHGSDRQHALKVGEEREKHVGDIIGRVKLHEMPGNH